MFAAQVRLPGKMAGKGLALRVEASFFKPGKFNLVLMDIQMPIVNGVEATKKLKEKYSNLPPIVGLSANAFEGDKERYMAEGLDEYLTKPLNKDDFENLMAELFG